MDTVIRSIELKPWIRENPSCKDYLSQGYKSAISDIKKNVFSDPRASLNDHIMNTGFRVEPKYFMAIRNDPIQTHLLLLACLYVFPKHRRQGYSIHLINQVKRLCGDQGVIQVAVEAEKKEELMPFYLKNGFQTTGAINSNEIGKKYLDFFWSGKKYVLHVGNNETILEPRPYDIGQMC